MFIISSLKTLQKASAYNIYIKYKKFFLGLDGNRFCKSWTCIKSIILFICLILANANITGQVIDNLVFHQTGGLRFNGITTTNNLLIGLNENVSLFTIQANGQEYRSASAALVKHENSYKLSFEPGLFATIKPVITGNEGISYHVTLENSSIGNIDISNILPFEQKRIYTYISKLLNMDVPQVILHVPGANLVPLVAPSDFMQIGFTAISLEDGRLLSAITSINQPICNNENSGFITLKSNEQISFNIFISLFQGEWSASLRELITENILSENRNFSGSVKRLEQQKCYLAVSQNVWDNNFYSTDRKRYVIYEFLQEGKNILGGYDLYNLMFLNSNTRFDARDQKEILSSLPWGLQKIEEIANFARSQNTRFYLEILFDANENGDLYIQDEINEITNIIKPDGLSVYRSGLPASEIVAAVNKHFPGTGLMQRGASLSELPNISAVRNDKELSTNILDLYTLLIPGLTSFRELGRESEDLRNLAALSLFNGTAIEFNNFSSLKSSFSENDLSYISRILYLLRQNDRFFSGNDNKPIIKSLNKDVLVNQWKYADKVLFTVYGNVDKGFDGLVTLLENDIANHHFVSLWHHEEIDPVMVNGKPAVPARLNQPKIGKQNKIIDPGLDLIIGFPENIRFVTDGDSLFIDAANGNKLILFRGHPSYSNIGVSFNEFPVNIKISDYFGWEDGKFVIQLFDNDELADQRVFYIHPGTPRLISKPETTPVAFVEPSDMVEIPGSTYIFSAYADSTCIRLPNNANQEIIEMKGFFMDKYPVTNEDFYQFLIESNYRPSNPVNFLKHWENGSFPRGQGRYPVVYVSLEDARAYAKWAGKRLPTDIEWQYAAQGNNGREWPWGDEFHATKCNNGFGRATPVNAFPKGESPFNVADLVGNVWQFTNNEYFDGQFRYVIIRGGSYIADSQGSNMISGPQPVNKRHALLLLSPETDRSATIGFRCVKDTR